MTLQVRTEQNSTGNKWHMQFPKITSRSITVVNCSVWSLDQAPALPSLLLVLVVCLLNNRYHPQARQVQPSIALTGCDCSSLTMPFIRWLYRILTKQYSISHRHNIILKVVSNTVQAAGAKTGISIWATHITSGTLQDSDPQFIITPGSTAVQMPYNN